MTLTPTPRFHGLPAAAVEFLPGDGNVVRLANGTWIATVSVWFARDSPMNVSDPSVKCCNVSVAVFRSDDLSYGLDWNYVATVATPERFRSAVRAVPPRFFHLVRIFLDSLLDDKAG